MDVESTKIKFEQPKSQSGPLRNFVVLSEENKSCCIKSQQQHRRLTLEQRDSQRRKQEPEGNVSEILPRRRKIGSHKKNQQQPDRCIQQPPKHINSAEGKRR